MGTPAEKDLAKQIPMNVRKQPTNLVDPSQTNKSWHEDGFEKGLHDFSSQDLDEFQTMKSNIWTMRGQGGWTQGGTLREPRSDTEGHMDDFSANKNRHPNRFER